MMESNEQESSPEPNKSSTSKGMLTFQIKNVDCTNQKAPRSRKGCITCKVRKKKCNEERPICKDCSRLQKRCVWIENSMTKAEVKYWTEKVEEDEKSRKLRIRGLKKVKTENNDTTNPTNNDNEAHTNNNMMKGKLNDTNGIQPGEPEITKEQDVKLDNLGLSPFSYHPTTPPSPLSPRMNLPPMSPISAAAAATTALHTSTNHSTSPMNSPLAVDNKLSPPRAISRIHSFTSLLNPDSILDQNEKNLNHFLSKQHPSQPSSPNSFLNFLKDLSHYQQTDHEHKITLLNDDMNDVDDIDSIKSDDDILGKVRQYENRIANFDNSSLEESLSPSFNQIFATMSNMLLPDPMNTPSTIPELSGAGYHLYNYYADTVSKLVSIAPSSQGSNSYQKVFLPLAHQDKGVLYGILAWASFHLGGEWAEEGAKYVDLAIDHISKMLTNSKRRQDEGEEVLNSDRNLTVCKLATLLILCGAEICRGDVKNWSVYLSWGWKILSSHGGILKFNQSQEEHWLISNFAYHDLLAASNSNRGTYFPSEQYDLVFQDKEGISRGRLNPLLGISKSLYKILGDIGTLVFESKKILRDYYQDDTRLAVSPEDELVSRDDELDEDNASQSSAHTRNGRLLLSVIESSNKLEDEIDCAKPNTEDLVDLTDEELELQLTMFEAFQITAKLFIRQAIRKINPSALESQMLVNDLIKCLDITISTSVQASLVLPVFMAGIHCVTPRSRNAMRDRIELYRSSYRASNVERVQCIMEEVWKINPVGDKVVDWYAILKEFDWDLNFA